jgi:hypothetical protein
MVHGRPKRPRNQVGLERQANTDPKKSSHERPQSSQEREAQMFKRAMTVNPRPIHRVQEPRED